MLVYKLFQQLPKNAFNIRRESQEDVIEVLNVLGYHGYVVMAMTKNSDNR